MEPLFMDDTCDLSYQDEYQQDGIAMDNHSSSSTKTAEDGSQSNEEKSSSRVVSLGQDTTFTWHSKGTKLLDGGSQTLPHSAQPFSIRGHARSNCAGHDDSAAVPGATNNFNDNFQVLDVPLFEVNNDDVSSTFLEPSSDHQGVRSQDESLQELPKRGHCTPHLNNEQEESSRSSAEQTPQQNCRGVRPTLVKQTLQHASIPADVSVETQAIPTVSVDLSSSGFTRAGVRQDSACQESSRTFVPITALPADTLGHDNQSLPTQNNSLLTVQPHTRWYGSLFDELINSEVMDNATSGSQAQPTHRNLNNNVPVFHSTNASQIHTPQVSAATFSGAQYNILSSGLTASQQQALNTLNTEGMCQPTHTEDHGLGLAQQNTIHSKEIIETLSGLRHGRGTLDDPTSTSADSGEASSSAASHSGTPSSKTSSKNSRKRSRKSSAQQDDSVGDPEKDVAFETPANFTPHPNLPEGYLTEMKLTKGTRRLQPNQVSILKYWMADIKHWSHPYPDENEKEKLAQQCNMSVTQVSDWFRNERKRVWLPLQRHQSNSASSPNPSSSRSPGSASSSKKPSRKTKRTSRSDSASKDLQIDHNHSLAAATVNNSGYCLQQTVSPVIHPLELTQDGGSLGINVNAPSEQPAVSTANAPVAYERYSGSKPFGYPPLNMPVGNVCNGGGVAREFPNPAVYVAGNNERSPAYLQAVSGSYSTTSMCQAQSQIQHSSSTLTSGRTVQYFQQPPSSTDSG